MRFKCSSIDLRQLDITAINSKVKSWLYSDQFLKPEELVLCRPTSRGGLGLQNVKVRALACLIKTFIETAANPNFQHSLYHESLHRYHVLDDHSLPDPGFPPYYSQGFFNTIRQVHNDSPLDVTRMSLKQWYHLLLEDSVTMYCDQSGNREYIPC